jgi:hypothetical protein
MVTEPEPAAIEGGSSYPEPWETWDEDEGERRIEYVEPTWVHLSSDAEDAELSKCACCSRFFVQAVVRPEGAGADASVTVAQVLSHRPLPCLGAGLTGTPRLRSSALSRGEPSRIPRARS